MVFAQSCQGRAATLLRFGGGWGKASHVGLEWGWGGGGSAPPAGTEGSPESGLDAGVVGVRSAGSVCRGAGVLEEAGAGPGDS